jgi:dCTP deaminase
MGKESSVTTSVYPIVLDFPQGLVVAPNLKYILQRGILQGSDEKHINQSTVDVTLGQEIMVERPSRGGRVCLRDREAVPMDNVIIGPDGYELRPGQFILAATEEVFNMPHCLSAQYHTKSSMGRIGLEHMNAGWCDPGWHGRLTLEFKNMLENSSILLHRGDRIGQVEFIHHRPIPEEQSYARLGAYQDVLSVSGSRKRE